MMKNKKNAFTLVELLAVIVILAIILVIAVPKVMSIIKDAKKGTLETTAKMIASAAEKKKLENTILEIDGELECKDVANMNDIDYADCKITFDGNTAKVKIIGSEKFEGLAVCEGTKTNASATEDGCGAGVDSIEVKYPLFLAGQELTPDKFVVTATLSDGTTRVLENGTSVGPDDTKAITITSPKDKDDPTKYPNNLTGTASDGSLWEKSFDNAVAVQIKFKTFKLQEQCGPACYPDKVTIYDESGNEIEVLGYDWPTGQTYSVTGNYIKVVMISDDSGNYAGFEAEITPIYPVEAEYTVSPSVAPSTGNFDITISLEDQGISKKITTNAEEHNANDYIVRQKGIDAIQTTATVNGETVDAGIRYAGSNDEVKNYVYFNCVADNYGNDGYNYASNCEKWRIIGVFDTKSTESSSETPVKRVKLVRNEVLDEQVQWDEYDGDLEYINQWGETTLKGGTAYAGSSLMQYLNGDYHNNLTAIAQGQIGDALWYTGAVTTVGTSSEVYEAERSDEVGTSELINYKTKWVGKVGLIYPSDFGYAIKNCDGVEIGSYSRLCSNQKVWLTSNVRYWTITPYGSSSNDALAVQEYGSVTNMYSFMNVSAVRPSVYLKPSVKITGGDGTENNPYRLSTGA